MSPPSALNDTLLTNKNNVLTFSDTELLKNDTPHGDPAGQKLQEIIVHIEKMDRILKKIRAITRYEAMEYIEGIQIIDIDKASQN